jgi:hypothetical protein
VISFQKAGILCGSMRHSKALYSHDLFQVEDEYEIIRIPSGKLTVCYGKSPSLIGQYQRTKWAIFNSYVKLPKGDEVDEG